MSSVKKIARQYRIPITALLVGWLLLCGLMPALSGHGTKHGGDHAIHSSMSGGAMAGHHGQSADHHGESTSSVGSPHCCDVMQGQHLPVQSLITDLLAIAAIGCLLFLLAVMPPLPPRLSFAPIPPTGPPLHRKHCVWLD